MIKSFLKNIFNENLCTFCTNVPFLYTEGVNLDVSEDGKIVGIEILDETKKFPLQTLFSCEYDPQLIFGEA